MLFIQNKRRFISFVSFIAITLIITFVALARLFWGTSQLQTSGELIIEEGSTAETVWQQLVEQNFTVRTTPWRYYAWRLNAAHQIQSGVYQLEKGEHIQAVIKRFMSGDVVPDELTITYPEGFTIQQIAARTAGKNRSTKEEFIAAAADPSEYLQLSDVAFLNDIPDQRNLEGYLFPDTYRIAADDTATDVIKRMLGTFAQKVNPLQSEISSSGRTLDEIIIMASIIEREVITDDDMALVAGVLWKRLDDGVGLGADATIRYILEKWEGPLTVQDLTVDSLYNTRKYRGLPPGPISNPGLRAIQAAINPSPSDFYYYLSTPTGQTIFSKTDDEHNANKARYLYSADKTPDSVW